MSDIHSMAVPSSRYIFQLMVNKSLEAYQIRRKDKSLTHPLLARLQYCNTPSSILAIVQEKIQELDLSRARDEPWRKWLDPPITTVSGFVTTLGVTGLIFLVLISQVFSYGNAVFAGSGVLFTATTDARVSKDKLADMLERIEMFLQRLEMYTEVPPGTEMMDVFVRIMVEVLFVLEIATREIEQGRIKRIIMRMPVIKRTEIADLLYRLDKLTQEEARMAVAQVSHCHNFVHSYVTCCPLGGP